MRPAASFEHPAWLASVLLLVLNDHVLKASGWFSGIVTGKLSDFAGLFVAPAVLAWLARVRTRRGWLRAHVAVGFGFSLVQLEPGARAAEALATSMGLHWRLWADPTDLVALGALCVSYAVLARKPSEHPRAERSSRRALPVGVLALVACTASPGAQRPTPRYPFPPRGILHTDLVLRHTSSEELVVSVRRLRDGVEVDCDRLLEAPGDTVSDDDFTEPRTWRLARGDALPLWDRRHDAPNRACYAVWLSSGDRKWLLAWRDGAPPMREVNIRLEPNVPAEPDAVVIRPDEPPRTPPSVRVYVPPPPS